VVDPCSNHEKVLIDADAPPSEIVLGFRDFLTKRYSQHFIFVDSDLEPEDEGRGSLRVSQERSKAWTGLWKMRLDEMPDG